MENLPIELSVKIVNELSIYNRFKLRRLNKRWMEFIDTFFNIENLSIGAVKKVVHDFFGAKELAVCFYFHPNKILELGIAFDQMIFRNVKNLIITETKLPILVSLLDQLHHLEKLECLEISWIHVTEKAQNITIKSNLKYLNIDSINLVKLTFDTPKLTNLRFREMDELNYITFLHPGSIRLLKTKRYCEKIVGFKNLEYFYCDFTPMQPDFLSKLCKLKESHHIIGRDFVRKLLLYKNSIERKNFKVFYQCILFDSVVELDQYDSQYNFPDLTVDVIKNLDDNLSNLIECVPSIYLDYKNLESYYESKNKKIPYELINKLKICSLKIRKVNNLENLTAVLLGFEKIQTVDIRSDLVKQSFLNDLPRLCPKLGRMTVSSDYNHLNSKQFNVEFLLNFRHLTVFTTRTQRFSIRFLEEFFENTELVYVSCIINDRMNSVTLIYKDNRFYKNTAASDKSFKNLEDLFNEKD